MSIEPNHHKAAHIMTLDHRQRRRRRVPVGMAFFALCMGLFALLSVTGNPRFETYHTLDVIRLITAGAGFGVALVLLIQRFASPVPPSEAQPESEQAAS